MKGFDIWLSENKIAAAAVVIFPVVLVFTLINDPLALPRSPPLESGTTIHIEHSGTYQIFY
jgi:hypothetical protein